jgi:hypothetical protein
MLQIEMQGLIRRRDGVVGAARDDHRSRQPRETQTTNAPVQMRALDATQCVSMDSNPMTAWVAIFRSQAAGCSIMDAGPHACAMRMGRCSARPSSTCGEPSLTNPQHKGHM